MTDDKTVRARPTTMTSKRRTLILRKQECLGANSAKPATTTGEEGAALRDGIIENTAPNGSWSSFGRSSASLYCP